MNNHDDEVAQMNALVREAHECIKDLRAAIRDAERVGDELRSVIATEFKAQFTAEANRVFGDYSETVMAAVTEAERLVFKRFDDLANELIGATRRQQRAGYRSLEDVARDARAAANEEKNRLI